jgi:hypothetical protein
MKLSQLISVLLVCLSLLAKSQTKKVLFVGNSYTYYGDLPGMTKSMSVSTGDTLIVESHTPGGRRIGQHADDPQVYTLMKQKNWDHVVFQCQSQEPSFNESHVNSSVYPAMKELCDSLKKVHHCAQPMMYMTWGRKNGDQNNCQFFEPLCTYEGMDSMLRLRYIQMAKDNKGDVSPVGWIWNQIRSQYPAYELYNKDESHPSFLGTYAAALTFYTMIWHKDPTNIAFNPGVNEDQATNLKALVKTEVFEQLGRWQYSPSPSADFTFDVEEKIVTFTAFQGGDHYRWDFGDGTSDTGRVTVHSFASTGSYQVRLITSICEKQDTAWMDLNVSTASIANRSNWKMTVYPNPATDLIEILGLPFKLDSSQLRVYQSNGVLIPPLPVFSGNKIDASSLASGIYFFMIQTPDNRRLSFQMTVK